MLSLVIDIASYSPLPLDDDTVIVVATELRVIYSVLYGPLFAGHPAMSGAVRVQSVINHGG